MCEVKYYCSCTLCFLKAIVFVQPTDSRHLFAMMHLVVKNVLIIVNPVANSITIIIMVKKE